MNKIPQKSLNHTNQQQKCPIIHSKQYLQITSYSYLKSKNQNTCPLIYKNDNFLQVNQTSTLYYCDSKIKLTYYPRQIKTTIFHDSLIKSKHLQKNETNQIQKQKVRDFVDDYAIKGLSADLNKRYIYSLYRGVKYSLQKLKQPSLEHQIIYKKELLQPTIAKDKFLLLDLDQTLIHTEKSSNFVSQSKVSYKVSIRPYVFTFLQKLSRFYEIYVFTSAVEAYAEAAISKLNKRHVYIKDFLSRQDCIQTRKGRFIKDLRIIKNRQLKDIIIIDNLVQSFCLQIDNGIPILSFDGQTKDQELLKLIPFLEQISTKEDVRPYIKQKFKLQKLACFGRAQIQKVLGVNVK